MALFVPQGASQELQGGIQTGLQNRQFNQNLGLQQQQLQQKQKQFEAETEHKQKKLKLEQGTADEVVPEKPDEFYKLSFQEYFMTLI